MIKQQWKFQIKFILVLIGVFIPITLLLIFNIQHHSILGTSEAVNGVFDLKGSKLAEGKEILLDGEWEFFYDKWIVTEELTKLQPDEIVRVPMMWKRNEKEGTGLISPKIGSFRLYIRNCPAGIHVTSFIPNIDVNYRLFLNGQLIALRGEMKPLRLVHMPQENVLGEEGSRLFSRQNHEGVELPPGRDAELVVELSSDFVGGLYMAPVLREDSSDFIAARFRLLAMAVIVGALCAAIICVFYLFIMGDRSISSLALLGMDVTVLLRILAKNEFFMVFNEFFPWEMYCVNSVLQILILFLPAVFLLAARQLVEIPVSKGLLKYTIIYEIIFVPFIIWCIVEGRPDIQFFLCALSYFPFVFIIKEVYYGGKRGTPYALIVSAILFMALLSIISSALNTSGLLVANVSLLAPIYFACSMFLQFWIYVKKNVAIQKQALEMENLRLRLKENEINLMLSQIKPHFLYNSLIAVHMLCTEEPETAAEAVLKFATFLRTNMNFINSKKPIDFQQELKHIENYLDLEKLRFRDRLDIRYDVETVTFLVPPLSIQPIVENAVKYGACKNIRGGMVTLRTREDTDCYCVEIEDDGPGFDTEILKRKEQDNHGLQNITYRLNKMLNAKITVESQPEKGTLVRVIIPKEEDGCGR